MRTFIFAAAMVVVAGGFCVLIAQAQNTQQAPSPPALTAEETAQAEDILGNRCTSCHGAETFTSLRNDKAGWESVLNVMAVNANLDAAQTDLVVKYLTANYGR